MRSLQRVLIVSVAALTCGAAAAGPRAGKRAKPIREMVSQSDAVCIGKIKSVRASGGSVQKGDHWYRTKTAEVEVVEAFKKVKKGDKISLVHSEIAGEMDVFDGAPRGMFLIPGSKPYLMFLKARGGCRALTEPDSANSLILLDRNSPAFKMLKRKRDETVRLKKKYDSCAYDDVEMYEKVGMLVKDDGTLSEEGIRGFRKYCEEIPKETEMVDKAKAALVEYARANPKAFKVEGVADRADGTAPAMVGPKQYRIGPFVVDLQRKTYVFTQHTAKKGGGFAIKWEYAGRFVTRSGKQWKATAPALRSRSPKKP
jgi:hypothetical protein